MPCWRGDKSLVRYWLQGHCFHYDNYPQRCFQRHGISRLPETQGDKPARKKFKSYPIGYFHIDIAEVRTEQGKLYLFVAIDRTSKFAYAELHETANRWIATDFLKALIKAVPYKIHTVLTDNGIQFTDLPKNCLDNRRGFAQTHAVG